LERAGFGPNFHECVNCAKKISEIGDSLDFYFSQQDGGLICAECLKQMKINQFVLISKNAIKVIKLILKGDINMIPHLPKIENAKVLEIAELNLNNIIEKPLSSPKFLKRVQEF
jgi:recombinational DNA repair protein (RecF pathway)